MRLDELLRRFRRTEKGGHRTGAEVARLGKRRAEMIARNHKVEPHKRAEKGRNRQLVPRLAGKSGAVFDWLEVRKQAPDYREKFPKLEEEE